MPRASEFASINPVILRWAREASGYDIGGAASKIKVPPERLLAAEQLTEKLSIPQLRRAAALYGRPVDIFYLPEPPAAIPEPKDFRTFGNAASAQSALTPNIRLEWRRALLKRVAALELFAEQGEKPPTIRIRAKSNEDPDEVARRVVAWLDIASQKSPSRRQSDNLLNFWIRVIEAQGVLVFQSSDFEIEEARGLSYWAKELPFILLNGRDSHRPRLFTLLHEFAHLLLHEAGSACDPLRGGVNQSPTESFCNRVAAAILIPLRELLEHPRVIRHRTFPRVWSDAEIQSLADIFGVSRQVLLIRLQHLGLTTSTFVQSRLEAFEEEFRQGSGPNKPKAASTGAPPPYVMALRDNGRGFCRLVLTAVDSNVISEIDAANYLGLKAKHFDSVRDALVRGRVVG